MKSWVGMEPLILEALARSKSKALGYLSEDLGLDP